MDTAQDNPRNMVSAWPLSAHNQRHDYWQVALTLLSEHLSGWGRVCLAAQALRTDATSVPF